MSETLSLFSIYFLQENSIWYVTSSVVFVLSNTHYHSA